MDVPFTPETLAEKSYNRCIRCEYLGTKCDGPNVISMDIPRFCEWCRLRKEELGWSVEKLAEVAGIGKATVAKIMTGKIPGLNGETVSAITCALVYGYDPNGEGWGKYPCAIMALEQEEQKHKTCPDCEKHMERHQENREKIDYLKKQVEFLESQLKEKDKHLDSRLKFVRQKDTVIVILCVLFALSLTLFILSTLGVL